MTAYISSIRSMSVAELRAAVDGFSKPYAADWDQWLSIPNSKRPVVFGQILRRWQATRPRPMRRVRTEATHGVPYLDDLLSTADAASLELGDLTVRTIRARTAAQERALIQLWGLFRQLASVDLASAVGITKAILLSTNGAIGPALDKTVRDEVGVVAPTSASQWLEILEAVADDISAFEQRNMQFIENCVADRYRSIGIGRLYDMALGPRGPADRGPPPR